MSGIITAQHRRVSIHAPAWGTTSAWRYIVHRGEAFQSTPPHGGRLAASALETLEQVRSHEPVVPRTLNPEVPRDLETICLKCLCKDSGGRYASSSGLAQDLGRWLRGEPIRARSVGLFGWAARWCHRNPALATMAALLVAVTIVAFVTVTRAWLVARNALAGHAVAEQGRALARIETLLVATPEAVPLVLADLDAAGPLVQPRLRELARKADLPPERRARVALALIATDPAQAAVLRSYLLTCPMAEFPLIRDALVSRRSALLPELWTAFRDPEHDLRARVRAGLALAGYAPDAPEWTDADAKFLVAMLLKAQLSDRPVFRAGLRPLADRLIGPLRRRLTDSAAGESDRREAAETLAEFAAGRPGLLAELASEAPPERAAVLHAALVRATSARAEAVRTLRSLAREAPPPDLDERGRVRLGRRRAGAAIELMLLGWPEVMADVARVGDDPEALTQFVHQVRSRGVPVVDLLDRLERTSEDQERFALLLALGEFRAEETPADRRATLTATLINWYRRDPSSAVHGACRWLLRAWGLDEPELPENEAPRAEDVAGRSRWFVRGVGEDSLTFIAFPPGRFSMGSPITEEDREDDERLHEVRITRPFALMDREVTRGQFERFLRAKEFPLLERLIQEVKPSSPSADHPAVGVIWYEAVAYCRWLTQQAGLAESDQCYEDPAQVEKTPEGFPRNWPFHPERAGFRLPTEAEWEYACRAGTVTRYSFGSDPSLVDRYGWSRENAGKSTHPGGALRPNLRGLFDLHGNTFEWCHDWYGAYPEGPAVDPIGDLRGGPGRLLRGGSWLNDAAVARSAMRNFAPPYSRDKSYGFRVTYTLQARVEPVSGRAPRE